MKRYLMILFAFFLFLPCLFYSQVAINTDGSAADASAILDVKSTEMGLLPPRMSAVEKCRISNPAEGLIIYNTTTHAIEIFNGSTWMAINEDGLAMDPLNYQVAIGGTGDDVAYSVIQAEDGGYLLAGATNSFGAGNYDLYAVKLNPDFSLDSDFGTNGSFVIGGSQSDYARSVVQAGDGGHLFGGYTYTFGQGGADFYLVKLTAAGIPDSSFGTNGTRTYGQSINDRGYCLATNPAGGFVLAGYGVIPASGSYESCLVCFTQSGGIESTFGTSGSVRAGGSGFETLNGVAAANGGLIAVGNTTSYGEGGYDVYILRFTSAGVPETTFGVNGTLTVGGIDDDAARAVIPTSDNGYLVVGSTKSFGAGEEDFYIVKLTSSGSFDSNFGTNGTLTFGGTGNEIAYSALETDEGDFLIAGSTTSFGAGGLDMYAVKISAAGVPDSTFQNNGTLTIGSTGDEAVYDICALADGGYLLAGYTDSFGSGSDDIYLVRINNYGYTCGYNGEGGSVTGSGGVAGNGGDITAGGAAGSGGTLNSGGTLTNICD